MRGPSESHADTGRTSAPSEPRLDGSSDSGGADADRGHAHTDGHSHRDGCTNADAGHAYGDAYTYIHLDIYGHADEHSHRDGCTDADAGDTHADVKSHPDGYGHANRGYSHSHRHADSSRTHTYTYTHTHTHTYTSCDRHTDTGHTHADPCRDGTAQCHVRPCRWLRGPGSIGIEIRADRGDIRFPVLG